MSRVGKAPLPARSAPGSLSSGIGSSAQKKACLRSGASQSSGERPAFPPQSFALTCSVVFRPPTSSAHCFQLRREWGECGILSRKRGGCGFTGGGRIDERRRRREPAIDARAAWAAQAGHQGLDRGCRRRAGPREGKDAARGRGRPVARVGASDGERRPLRRDRYGARPRPPRRRAAARARAGRGAELRAGADAAGGDSATRSTTRPSTGWPASSTTSS